MSDVERARSGLLLAQAAEAAQVLRDAANLIEPEGKWTQGYYAKTAAGEYTEVWCEDAACFCARGAIAKAACVDENAGYSAFPHFTQPLTLAVGSITRWNDSVDRTQAEVVAALRDAADRIEVVA